MKYLLAIFLTAFLAACSGGGGPAGLPNPVVIDPGGQTVRLDRTDTYAVDIPTSNNRVTIASGNHVSSLDVDGTGNVIVVEFSSIVSAIDIGGANNTISLGTTVTVADFVVSGSNAVVNIGASDTVDRLAVIGSNAQVTIQGFSANVPDILLAGSNILLRIPGGYTSKTTIRNTGANNLVQEL